MRFTNLAMDATQRLRYFYRYVTGDWTRVGFTRRCLIAAGVLPLLGAAFQFPRWYESALTSGLIALLTALGIFTLRGKIGRLTIERAREFDHIELDPTLGMPVRSIIMALDSARYAMALAVPEYVILALFVGARYSLAHLLADVCQVAACLGSIDPPCGPRSLKKDLGHLARRLHPITPEVA